MQYCFNALIFGNISSACAKKIFNCCNVLMLSWSRSSRSNSGSYLRDYNPQWTPFLARFLWWHQQAVRELLSYHVGIFLVMGFQAVRLTVHALDVVLSVRRRVVDIISYIWTLFHHSGQPNHQIHSKIHKIHLCGPPDTDSRHAANGRSNTSTLRRLPRHSHQLCL